MPEIDDLYGIPIILDFLGSKSYRLFKSVRNFSRTDRMDAVMNSSSVRTQIFWYGQHQKLHLSANSGTFLAPSLRFSMMISLNGEYP